MLLQLDGLQEINGGVEEESMVYLDAGGLFTREGSYRGVPYKISVCAISGEKAYGLDVIQVSDFPPHKVGARIPYPSVVEALDAADGYARMIIDQQH